MSSISSIKKKIDAWIGINTLQDYLSVGSIDYRNAHKSKFSHIKIENTQFKNVKDVINLCNNLIECILMNTVFDKKKLPRNDPEDIYLTDFLYDRFYDIQVMNDKIKEFLNDFIYLEALTHENDSNRDGIYDHNISIAKFTLRKLGSIYDQLMFINEEINYGSIVNRRRKYSFQSLKKNLFRK